MFGKSTLINSVFHTNITQEGIISVKNKRGKNTTTQVRLYHLQDETMQSSGTYIADTPGFSTFEIDEIESVDLCHYYIEFVPYIERCQFIGCSHVKEDKCGIKEAIEQGEISKERYQSYCKIYQEIKQKEEKRW